MPFLPLKNHRSRTRIFWQFLRRMDAALLTQGRDETKKSGKIAGVRRVYIVNKGYMCYDNKSWLIF